MNAIRRKQPRLRLAPAAYRQLCQQILERDGWRCQCCGAARHLHVHHKQLRSHSGDDSEENLITLCEPCHELVHRFRRTSVS
jgi:5-methylcytosine-specific restriction endonuclease McrA